MQMGRRSNITFLKAMATFRSDFNSVPNTYNERLTAFRKKFTTCFQQCRQQLLKFHSNHLNQKNRDNNQFYKLFARADGPIFGGKATYLRKFKNIFQARQNLKNIQRDASVPQTAALKTVISQEEQQKEEQLQIIATLFSSTLISQHSFNQSTSTNMTILDNTYIGIRDDYPDIDTEIRAILLANAQNGVTISSIKKEYRQLTGNIFPLNDNVTDFLLTIPHVTAECCASGKRLFNIKPTDETRHLHEMIVQQRQRECNNNNNNKQNHNVESTLDPPRLWRSQYNKRRSIQSLNSNMNISEKPSIVKVTSVPQLATAAQAPIGIYQDNWKHLNNQYQFTQPAAACNNNNNNYYSIGLDPGNLQVPQPPLEHQQLQHQLQRQQFEEYAHKRSYGFTPTPTTLSCHSQHDSMFTMNSDYDAYLLDFPLLGDDFFLYLARMELKCRFKKYEKVLQSGLCISGQTINAARQRLRHVELPEMTQIIVNIGSVDIMRGNTLVQIEHDFRQLIKEMHNRRFVPVLTTLAPLANYRHDKQTCEKVSRFNKFIRSEGRHLTVIDIHACLVNEHQVVRFDCFQNGPRNVTGSTEPYVFWNKIGRQRVLQMIEQNVEYC